MKRKIILMMLCCYMPAEDHALESVQETYAMVRKPSNVKGNWHWKDLTSFMLTTMFWEQLKCMLVLVLLGDFSDSDVIYFFFLIYISFKHTVCVSCCWYFELCFVDLRKKKTHTRNWQKNMLMSPLGLSDLKQLDNTVLNLEP